MWCSDMDAFFFKVAFQSVPTLGLHEPTRHFTETDEKNACITSVLLQGHGEDNDLWHIFSKIRSCSSKTVWLCMSCSWKSHDIVSYTDLTLLVPDAVYLILSEQKMSHLLIACWLRYATGLLDMPNITVKCNVLTATLLPIARGGEKHNCVVVLNEAYSPHPYYSETPLPNHDLVLFGGFLYLIVKLTVTTLTQFL